MRFDSALSHCPKCDYGITEQNRRDTYTRDVAHNRQTVAEASAELYSVLDTAKREQFGYVRLVVGGGRIKEEIGHLLETEQWRGTIRSFELDHPNTGAYLVKL